MGWVSDNMIDSDDSLHSLGAKTEGFPCFWSCVDLHNNTIAYNGWGISFRGATNNIVIASSLSFFFLKKHKVYMSKW